MRRSQDPVPRYMQSLIEDGTLARTGKNADFYQAYTNWYRMHYGMRSEVKWVEVVSDLETQCCCREKGGSIHVPCEKDLRRHIGERGVWLFTLQEIKRCEIRMRSRLLRCLKASMIAWASLLGSGRAS